MRVSTFVDLKQSREEVVEHDKRLKWVIGQADSENRAILYIKDIQNDAIKAKMILLDLVRSEHPMYEELDKELDALYAFPRFGLIYIENLEVKEDEEIITMWKHLEVIINDYFNGYVLPNDENILKPLDLSENNGYGLIFKYLNESYLFFQNPSHTM